VRVSSVGQSELWQGEEDDYIRLPHRPLFRPSPEALVILDSYERCAGWSEFSRWDAPAGGSWRMLSFAPSIAKWTEKAARAGFYSRLERGRDFILLGLVIRGGQGLATADDRRFLAAADNTHEAARAVENRERLAELTLKHDEASRCYRAALSRGVDVEAALLEVSHRFRDSELRWPRTGLIRVAPSGAVRSDEELTADEVENGIRGDRHWVRFEKGDDTGPAGGAKWCRSNPIVIDWSPDSVSLLRARGRQKESYRRAFLTNQELWGRGGVTYNGVASYLRARILPVGSIFGHMAPILQPAVEWLTANALLAFLNAPVVDFATRTFLGSRMHIETSDLRRLPIPVLSVEATERLDDLGSRAVEAKEAADLSGHYSDIEVIEQELDEYVRNLYGVSSKADLWVVR
jgi:hypothetical protein